MLENGAAAWYFYSASAQSAAAFAALAAVFATFRLQANDKIVDSARNSAMDWLALRDPNLRSNFHAGSVQHLLSQIIDGTRPVPGVARSEAQKLLSNIEKQQNYPKIVGARLAVPLMLWGVVFLFSTVMLPWKQLPGWLVGVSAVMIVLISFVALAETRRFIQDSIEAPSPLSEKRFLVRVADGLSSFVVSIFKRLGVF